MNNILTTNASDEAVNPRFCKGAVSGSCFRIITDNYCGYEVQIRKRFLFWTWWQQGHMYGCINTHSSVDDAKKWIEAGRPKKKPFEVVWVSGIAANVSQLNEVAYSTTKLN
jgi:hypothetical protein